MRPSSRSKNEIKRGTDAYNVIKGHKTDATQICTWSEKWGNKNCISFIPFGWGKLKLENRNENLSFFSICKGAYLISKWHHLYLNWSVFCGNKHCVWVT